MLLFYKYIFTECSENLRLHAVDRECFKKVSAGYLEHRNYDLVMLYLVGKLFSKARTY